MDAVDGAVRRALIINDLGRVNADLHGQAITVPNGLGLMLAIAVRVARGQIASQEDLLHLGPWDTLSGLISRPRGYVVLPSVAQFHITDVKCGIILLQPSNCGFTLVGVLQEN